MCYTVAVAREWLGHVEESDDRLAKFVHGTAAMISGHGVMHGLPEPLDDIDPGAIGRLEQKLELRILLQPAPRHSTLVDHVVIEDEHDGPSPAIRSTKVLEQLQEQRRGLSVMFDPDHPAGVSM